MSSAIAYKPGVGKSSKAVFQCGAAIVPASLISRIISEVSGKGESTIVRTLISKLEANRPGKGSYRIFLDEIERMGLSYMDAFNQMVALKGDAGSEAKSGETRFKKEAESVAKMLTRKYANKTPEEMIEKFIATVDKKEFREFVVLRLKEFEKTYGRNKQNKIRTRRERPEMKERATKARLGRGKKA